MSTAKKKATKKKATKKKVEQTAEEKVAPMSAAKDESPSTSVAGTPVAKERAESVAQEYPLLTDWFDRVFVINCATRPDRMEGFREEITQTGVADLSKIKVVSAVIGEYTTHPHGWPSGNGAWGCLQSHRRIMEDLMHERDERDDIVWDKALFLEDDIFFLDDALMYLNALMRSLPEDWGQIYLGGQHRKPVTELESPDVIRCNSVNRTHAYAVGRHSIQKIYRHISYLRDYHGKKHLDHQLELGHQRGDWVAYGPPTWICGQKEGLSDICGKHVEEKTWM